MQTNFRELVLCESKRRPNFTQNEHTGPDLGQMEIPWRDGVTLVYFKWEDGCIHSKGSSHAAGHQSTNKLNVKCEWQICNWHCFFNQPIQPFLVFLIHAPKSSLARKFAQFYLYLPGHRHCTAWCPRELISCCMTGNMWHSAHGCSLGAQGKKELSSFLMPTALGRAHHSLMLRGTCHPMPSFIAHFTSTPSALGYLLCSWCGR